MNTFRKQIMDAYCEGREDQHNNGGTSWRQDAEKYFHDNYEAPLQKRIDELVLISNELFKENEQLRRAQSIVDKWCDSCGKTTKWIDGKCENYKPI